MIKVTVIALSSLKEKYLKQACSEYEKRLSGYCKLEIIEIEPVKISQKPSQNEIDAALKKEAELINKKIPSGSFKAAACIEGRQFSSEKFSLLIKKAAMEKGSITFIIGSSYGLDSSIKEAADLMISVSEMTFPHQLFRVMLLEQIYRGFKINEGSAYHK